jgi:protein TonB
MFMLADSSAIAMRIVARPGAVSLVASIGLHIAVLLAYASGHTEPPRFVSVHTIEIELSGGAPRSPAHPPEPEPKIATAPETLPEPVATTGAPAAIDDKDNDAGDNAVAEARYDVAALNNPKPPYPLAARRRGLEGRVVLSARVRTDGGCDDVQLKQSSGHAALDAAALGTVRKWRFVPARRGGAAVEARVEVPIVFKLDS